MRAREREQGRGLTTAVPCDRAGRHAAQPRREEGSRRQLQGWALLFLKSRYQLFLEVKRWPREGTWRGPRGPGVGTEPCIVPGGGPLSRESPRWCGKRAQQTGVCGGDGPGDGGSGLPLTQELWASGGSPHGVGPLPASSLHERVWVSPSHHRCSPRRCPHGDV